MESITSSGSGVGSHVNNGSHTSLLGGEKVIIDTDPGIDDSITILMAFQTPEIDVIGLTTIFGNVSTVDATRNALLLCEVADHPDVPVTEGAHEPLKGGEPRIADFVHGSDGLGEIALPPPLGKKTERSASEFLVEKVNQYPGEVSILALGPLTNLALAIKRDSSFASKVKRIVVLGGAFLAAGNVNPAAEANVKLIALRSSLSSTNSPSNHFVMEFHMARATLVVQLHLWLFILKFSLIVEEVLRINA